MSDALAFAQKAVDIALDAGATQAEASISVGDRFSCEARDATITKLEQSTGRSLQMRIFAGGRKSGLTVSDFDLKALRATIETAVAQARHVADDPYAALPDRREDESGAHADLELFAQDVPARDPQAKVDEALAIEKAIRALDSRITNSNGAHVGDTASTLVLVNSLGFSGGYRSTRAHRSVSPVGADGASKRTGSYGTAARSIGDLEDAQTVARKAVERTLGMFGARRPQTTRVPVIFERDIAASVLSDIFTAVSASNVSAGNSWAAERMNERIGSDLVTLIDDGTMPGLLGSSPFDGEGVPTRRTMVVERGVLRSFLFDSYYARKLGAQTTGNSTGGGIGPNNFYLEPGSGTLEELIAKTGRGVLVIDTIGFATEYASGTYSRGARGFWIEDGKLAYPIEEFTIASTFASMLAGIDAVAGDLRFDGSVVSPSFRVEQMTISGD